MKENMGSDLHIISLPAGMTNLVDTMSPKCDDCDEPHCLQLYAAADESGYYCGCCASVMCDDEETYEGKFNVKTFSPCILRPQNIVQLDPPQCPVGCMKVHFVYQDKIMTIYTKVMQSGEIAFVLMACGQEVPRIFGREGRSECSMRIPLTLNGAIAFDAYNLLPPF